MFQVYWNDAVYELCVCCCIAVGIHWFWWIFSLDTQHSAQRHVFLGHSAYAKSKCNERKTTTTKHNTVCLAILTMGETCSDHINAIFISRTFATMAQHMCGETRVRMTTSLQLEPSIFLGKSRTNYQRSVRCPLLPSVQHSKLEERRSPPRLSGGAFQLQKWKWKWCFSSGPRYLNVGFYLRLLNVSVGRGRRSAQTNSIRSVLRKFLKPHSRIRIFFQKTCLNSYVP